MGTNENYENITQEGIFDSNGNQEDCLPVAVIDTSYLAGAILSDYCSDESTESRMYIEDLLSKNGQIVVPQLFWFEIGNVLLNASRPRKNGEKPRISPMQVDDIMLCLSELPIYTDTQPVSEIRSHIMHIAYTEGLSYFEASYLELSRRKELPLKTWDSRLSEAASRSG